MHEGCDVEPATSGAVENGGRGSCGGTTTATGQRDTFPLDPSLAAEMTALTAGDQACCQPFGFQLRIEAEALHLDIEVPGSAEAACSCCGEDAAP